MTPRPITLLAALSVVLVPLAASAQAKVALPASLLEATPEQVAGAMPEPVRHGLLRAKDRRQYVAETVAFARSVAGSDGTLTTADARRLAPDDPRAVEIRYFLRTPYLEPYYRSRKLGSRSVPRIPVHRMTQLAGALWDKFDTNHDGVLSNDEKAPLRRGRGRP